MHKYRFSIAHKKSKKILELHTLDLSIPTGPCGRDVFLRTLAHQLDVPSDSVRLTL